MSFLQQVAEDLHVSNPKFTVQDFLSLLQHAHVWEFPWGVIFAVQNDMHIHVLSTWRKHVFFRRELRKVAAEMFHEHAVLTTKIAKTKPWALDFDLRLGWKLTNEDEHNWILTMTKKDFDDVWL